VIYQQRGEYTIERMCKFFQVSRAAYYAWLKKIEGDDPDQERLQWVQEAYTASRRIYGYRRISLWLRQKRGVIINPKAVLRLMNKINIRSRARQRRLFSQAEQIGTLHRYPNVLRQNFVAQQPNQKWVTDITYIDIQQGWAYLSIIKDLFDGFIVAHVLQRRNSIFLVTETLRLAKQREKVTKGLIVHSDQGYQYSSQSYNQLLVNEYHITPSMSRRGNCLDNAPAENFFSHLKEEYMRHYKSPTFDQACQLIDEYIYFYNHERIQLKTRQTPYQTRCLSG
jgi:putative transposase